MNTVGFGMKHLVRHKSGISLLMSAIVQSQDLREVFSVPFLGLGPRFQRLVGDKHLRY